MTEYLHQGLTERIIKCFYKGISVGKYRTDIIVEDKVIIEFKAISQLTKVHEAQLVNFGEKLNFKGKNI